MIKKHSLGNLSIAYIGLVFSFFNTILKTKIITAEEIGILSLILTFSGILYYIIVLGMPNIILKFFPDYKKSDSEKMGFIIFVYSSVFLLFLFIVFILFFLRGKMSEIINDKVYNYFIYIALFLFVEVIFQISDSILRSLYKSLYSNFIKNLLNNILHLILILFLMFTHLGFSVYIKVYIIIQFIIVILTLIILFFNLPIKTKPSFNFLSIINLKRFYTYGLLMLLSSFMITFIYKVDKLFLMKYSTLQNLGIYTIAVTIGNIMRIIGTSINRVGHPKLSELLKIKQINKVEELYKQTASINILLGIFVFIVLFYLSRDILGILNNIYITGYSVILFIAMGELVNIGTGMCGGIVSFSELYKYDLMLNIFLLFLNVILNAILIPLFDIRGAAIATAISIGIYNIIKLRLVYYKYHIHPFSKRYLGIIIKGIIIFTLIFIINYCINRFLQMDTIFLRLILVLISGSFLLRPLLHKHKEIGN